MQVQIFSIMLSSDYPRVPDYFHNEVNQCLKEHPKAKIEWLQTSAAGGGTTYSSHTTLTAIVSYDEAI